MKMLTFALAASSALMLFAPLGGASAQSVMTPAPVVAHGDWTLHQRQEWLNGQLEKSVADGSLTKASFNQARLEMRNLANEESRMRHDASGQLTGNQTTELNARLDTIAAKIHWANMEAHTRPW
jgi:hypothetical protein